MQPPTGAARPPIVPLQQQSPASQQQPPNQATQVPVRRRACAEVCLELLNNEVTRFYSQDQGPAHASVALDSIGVRLGRQLVERHVRDRPRLGDTLEIIKYICKEFWPHVFKKSIDNLRTNHRGVYVLQDNNFRWLMRLAPPANVPPQPINPAQQEATRKLAVTQLLLPCGIVKGSMCVAMVVHCAEPDSLRPAAAGGVQQLQGTQQFEPGFFPFSAIHLECKAGVAVYVVWHTNMQQDVPVITGYATSQEQGFQLRIQHESLRQERP